MNCLHRMQKGRGTQRKLVQGYILRAMAVYRCAAKRAALEQVSRKTSIPLRLQPLVRLPFLNDQAFPAFLGLGSTFGLYIGIILFMLSKTSFIDSLAA